MPYTFERNYEYVCDLTGLERVFNWLNDAKYTAIDTETSGLNCFTNDIILMQLGDESKQWILDCRAVDIKVLKDRLEDSKLPKVGVNLKFDYKFLAYKYGIRPTNMVDTMLSEQILRCGLMVPASMEAMAERYLGIQIDKDETLRNSFGHTPVGKFTERQLDYASGDVIFPIEIAKKQKALISVKGLKETVKLEFDVMPVIAEMELAGIGVDKKAWLALAQESELDILNAEKELDKFFGVKTVRQEDLFGESKLVRSFDYGSNKKLKDALTKRGIILESTEKKNIILAAVLGQMPVELAQALISWRRASKKKSTYGTAFLEAIDETTGRVHSDFPQCRTTSGRLSSREDDDSETTKVNLQNIPANSRYRQCFVPRKGYKFIVYDYQALEPRILGEISKDPTYEYVFKNNKDIYGEIGFRMLNEEVSKKEGRPKELRDKTKITLLGNNYGTGKPKFFNKMLTDMNYNPDTGKLRNPPIIITREESDKLWESYFEACPMIRPTLDFLSAKADSASSERKLYDEVAAFEDPEKVKERLFKRFELHGPKGKALYDKVKYLTNRRGWIAYSETLGGRKRFFKVYHGSCWTDGRNHPIQGTGADILKYAMVLVAQAIGNKFDAKIVNQVHDEILIEVREDQAEELSPIVKEMCLKAQRRYLKNTPPKVEGGVRDKWEK